jgi:hypothetical protein
MVASRLVLLLFLAAQGWDGVFTYVAVGAHGVAAEGNALVAEWMALVGPGAAVLGAKLLAAGCGIVLYLLGVHHVLAGLTLLYALVAIGPWLMIFGGG